MTFMILHLSTFLTRSPTGLLNRIRYLVREYAGHDLTLLFALSANFPDTQDLGRAVTELTNLTRTRTVGCLSGRLGNTTINGKKVEEDILSLSVAVLDSKNIRSFRSTIPGKEEAQVGRWHAFRRKNEDVKKDYPLIEGVSWKEVWEGGRAFPLPEDLQLLDPSKINNIIYLSDLKPEGLLSSFRHLPNAVKLGLFASSTPFITGRPVTLFQDQEIFSSGAVGLAFTRETSVTTRPTLVVDFLDVRALSKPMVITQCEGNMVNALDGTNPTQLLISTIKESGLSSHALQSLKEEEFSLGVLSEDGKFDCLYRITAGDPSRGNISIDSPSTPPIGTHVQFLHRRSAIPPNLFLAGPLQSLSFLAVSDDFQPSNSQQSGSACKDFEMLLQNKLLVASENGFAFERAERPGENIKCSLPGSLGSLQWPFAS